MSQQKKKKTVAFAAIVAVVVAVSAGFVLVIPHLQTVATNSSNNKDTASDSNQVSDSAGSSSIGHVGMMRTINNTHCVNTPGGPQIC